MRVSIKMNTTDNLIHDLLSGQREYDDAGAGAYNAGLLTALHLRPAFFDTSCLLYRLAYAKASTYCEKAGDNDELLIWLVCLDFMRDVADACLHFACAPIMAFDSRVSFRRELLFADYKLGRASKQKKDESQTRVLALLPRIRRTLKGTFCPAYGIQTFCVHGYESDDIIADFVLGLKQPRKGNNNPAFDRQVVIVTNDHDLYQLLYDGVYVADVNTGILADGKQIAKHTGVAPCHVVAAKTIGGCKSDCVPGVLGCGDKTVAEVLANGNSNVKLKRARAALQSEEGLAILQRNRCLVELPFKCECPMPNLLLSAKVWMYGGVSGALVARCQEFGIAGESIPMFRDTTSSKVSGSMHICSKEGVTNV